MSQVKGMVQRTTVWQSLAELGETLRQKRVELEELMRQKTAELEEMVKGKTAEVEKLTVQLEQLNNKKAELITELNTLKIERRTVQQTAESLNTVSLERARAVKEINKQELMNTLLGYLAEHPDATLTEMAAAIERSKATASNYVNELTENGRLHKNGHGWEVRS